MVGDRSPMAFPGGVVECCRRWWSPLVFDWIRCCQKVLPIGKLSFVPGNRCPSELSCLCLLEALGFCTPERWEARNLWVPTVAFLKPPHPLPMVTFFTPLGLPHLLNPFHMPGVNYRNDRPCGWKERKTTKYSTTYLNPLRNRCISEQALDRMYKWFQHVITQHSGALSSINQM